MKLLRVLLTSWCSLAAASALAVVPTDASASVSIAVTFDALVKDADAVAVATPVESKSTWEDGRIYTYTKVKIEQGVAGEMPTGSEEWIRTMGGVVGKIGQMVDGEPVLTAGKPALLFAHRFKTAGTWEVSARAQGQFPIVTDEATKLRKVVRSANVGVLLPPRPKPSDAKEGTVSPQSISASELPIAKLRFAAEALHERPLDEVVREVAASWKKAHPVPATK